MANYYVSGNRKEGYRVKKENASRASKKFNVQSAAENAAKIYSANSGGGEVRIQNAKGKFRDSDTVSPAKDPFPPRDKKY